MNKKTHLNSHIGAATYLGTGRNCCLAAILTVRKVIIIDKVSLFSTVRTTHHEFLPVNSDGRQQNSIYHTLCS